MQEGFALSICISLENRNPGFPLSFLRLKHFKLKYFTLEILLFVADSLGRFCVIISLIDSNSAAPTCMTGWAISSKIYLLVEVEVTPALFGVNSHG